jgi:ZIP family zinc transporter
MPQPLLALVFVGVTFFSTLVGGLFVLRNSRLSVKYFFAFAAGALLGVSFFDLMPEVIDIVTTERLQTVTVMASIVVAFLLFHTLDRAIVIHAMSYGHNLEDKEHPRSPLLVNGIIRATGLSIHSFLDGVAIGTAFHITFQFGLIVGLAVLFHDFSDGLNTVTVMLRAGSSSKTALLWLLLDATTPTLGALTALLITLSPSILALMLSFFVGEFLYIGAADLLPEAHQRGTSFRLVLATIIGVALIFGVTRFLNL